MEMKGTPNPPMSKGDLVEALREFGSWEEGRQAFIELLIGYEAKCPRGTGVDVRERVSGPILDALHGHGRPIMKKLSSGLTISARYTSKIIRDFVMAGPEPDHVWEPQTTKTLLALTQKARHVLIGGAYIGDHAILVADQLRKRGTIHCFELSEQNISLLKTNVVQNDLDNVEINKVALWSQPDVRLTLIGDDSHATPRVAQDGAANSFPATTIESYASSRGIAKIDLIMLDIEGGELNALMGAHKLLSASNEVAPIVIYEIHAAYSDWSDGFANAEINRYLAGFGYSLFAIRDYQSNVTMVGMPIELVEINDIYVEGPKHGFNMLATKTPDKLDGTLFKRVRSVSPKLLAHRDPALHAPLARVLPFK